MKRISKWSLVAAVLVSVGLLAGCGNSSTQQSTANSSQLVELNVSAAVSMKDALTEIQAKYQEKHPNVQIHFNLGASGALQKQIEQGAPADLFISAAAKQMDELEAKSLIQKDTRKNLVDNQLVLITPKNSNLGLNQYEDLAKPEVTKLSIGAPESVPAGQYAQDVLKKIGLWDKIQDKMVLAKDVRTVLAYVETGNVEAGIVYRTDAASSEKVQIAATAPAGSQPIVYPVAVLSGAKQPKEAAEFLAFLTGPEAKAIFEKYGFVMSK